MEELSKKVTRLRAQASERAAAIESVGDTADTARLPPELNQRQLEEQAKLQASKQLAKEMTANEAHDMNQGGMWKMRPVSYTHLTLPTICSV